MAEKPHYETGLYIDNIVILEFDGPAGPVGAIAFDNREITQIRKLNPVGVLAFPTESGLSVGIAETRTEGWELSARMYYHETQFKFFQIRDFLRQGFVFSAEFNRDFVFSQVSGGFNQATLFFPRAAMDWPTESFETNARGQGLVKREPTTIRVFRSGDFAFPSGPGNGGGGQGQGQGQGGGGN